MVVNAQHIKAVPGKSARKMLEELVSGNEDIEAIANLAIRSLRDKIAQLREALRGFMGDHQRLMPKLMLRHIDDLDAQIDVLDNEIKDRLRHYDEQVKWIDQIPDVGERSAQVIIAEIGTGMSVFPSAAHLASWAGICPGNHESAGKRKSGKTRKGSSILRAVLSECCKVVGHAKDAYLKSQYPILLESYYPQKNVRGFMHPDKFSSE